MRVALVVLAAAAMAAAAVTHVMQLDEPAAMIAIMKEELLRKGERAPGPLYVETGETAFMKRYGLTRDVYPMEDELVSRLGGSTDKLQGLFMVPCMQYGNSPEGLPVSSFDTRVYDANFNYQLDRTYYIGDPTCKPSLSSIYFKMVLTGKISYHGVNKLPNICTKKQSCAMATMSWQTTSLWISNTTYGRSLAPALNSQCKCSTVFTVGTFMNISASNCSMPKDPSSDYYLCAIMAGGNDFFNYEWTDPYHYITSRDYFSKAEGYNQPVITSYVRERIPESGQMDPNDCDYLLFNECNEGIYAAMSNCQGCIDLECDGCLFRELNPNWDYNSTVNVWHQCCPCMYAFADRFQLDWLRTQC